MIIRMTLDLPAEAALVSLVRGLAETLLTDMGVVRQTIDDIELIVGEVCANAVRHAYDNPEERYQVDLDFYKDEFSISVSDHGRGADPRDFQRDPAALREGGRGVMIVQALSDRFDCQVQGGTTIRSIVHLRYKNQAFADRAAAMDVRPAVVTVGPGPEGVARSPEDGVTRP